MTEYYVKDDALHDLIDSGFSYAFIAGDVPDTVGDMRMRWAELGGVIQNVVRHQHDVFASKDELEYALFANAGGGFGIPIVMQQFVLRELVVEAT